MKINIKSTVGCFISMLFLFSINAEAGCSLQGVSTVINTINFGNIIANNDSPVGTVLATVTVPATAGRLLTCERQVRISSMMTLETVATSVQSTFNTNIPGIGMRVELPSSTSYKTEKKYMDLYRDSFDRIIPDGVNVATNVSFNVNSGIASFNIELVKTGPMSAGTLTPGLLLKVYDTVGMPNFMEVYLGTGTVSTTTCRVNSSTINVDMGDTMDSEFSGPGSTSVEKAFDVPINCDVTQKVSVNLSAGAAGSYDAEQGIINLDGSDANLDAQGLGLQVLYRGAPVPLNKEIDIGTADVGAFLIPFTARYYQTQPSITAGKANASATMILTYQ